MRLLLRVKAEEGADESLPWLVVRHVALLTHVLQRVGARAVGLAAETVDVHEADHEAVETRRGETPTLVTPLQIALSPFVATVRLSTPTLSVETAAMAIQAAEVARVDRPRALGGLADDLEGVAAETAAMPRVDGGPPPVRNGAADAAGAVVAACRSLIETMTIEGVLVRAGREAADALEIAFLARPPIIVERDGRLGDGLLGAPPLAET